MIDFDEEGIRHRFALTIEYLKYKEAFKRELALSRQLGIPKSYIGDIRSGRMGLPLKTLVLLKAQFPKWVSYDYILDNHPSPEMLLFLLRTGSIALSLAVYSSPCLQ